MFTNRVHTVNRFLYRLTTLTRDVHRAGRFCCYFRRVIGNLLNRGSHLVNRGTGIGNLLCLVVTGLGKHPNTHIAVVKALIRAGKWLDASPENRVKACEILCRPEYVGADQHIIANSMTGTWEYYRGDKRPLPDFNVFFRHYATYPYYSDCIWYLTQMRRWGQIAEAKPDDWYLATAKEVYKPEIYLKAAHALIQEGKLKEQELPKTDGFKPPTKEFIDGIRYDGRTPNEYLKQFPIGLKD